MTKLTTELLEKYIKTLENDDLCLITESELESVLRQLLAYEQAAMNPVAWTDSDELEDANKGYSAYLFGLEGEANKYADPRRKIMLYAAPVLPKQPEHSRQHFESLCNQFWNWAELDEIDQDEEPRLEWNGSNYTHRVTAALWKMYQAAPAQPVSEPYKLKDAVEDIRNSGVEIDADKINAERDTLNSPVIPDGSADIKRLNWLDAQNARLNEYYGTSYGWKFDANFQRNAMMLNDCNFPVMTVRQAIDEAMLAAAPAQESE